jgi:hypothetical protein
VALWRYLTTGSASFVQEALVDGAKEMVDKAVASLMASGHHRAGTAASVDPGKGKNPN